MPENEYKTLERWMSEIDKKLDNHLVHSATDISQIKNDIDWIKRFFWLVSGISITAVVSTGISLIFK